MDELKPCPFCGAKPVIRQWPVSNNLYIACVNPKCLMKPDTGLKGYKKLSRHIAAWNRRANDEHID